jgi:peptidoglycan/xylan/chitin deacetylase (PgdA/CDA1 family)
MEFGSHGATHASMIALDREQALNELTRSRLHIEDHLGEAVTAFSFPYGYYNSNLIKLTATAGYTACCLSDHGTVRLPARVIPRNSINSAMRWPAILKTLEPSPLVHASWIVEDWTKKLVKRVLSDRTYQSLRGAIGKNKNKN